jgi:hypothetical protein
MVSTHTYRDHLNAFSNQLGEEYLGARNFENQWCVLPWMKPTVLVNGKITDVNLLPTYIHIFN